MLWLELLKCKSTHDTINRVERLRKDTLITLMLRGLRNTIKTQTRRTYELDNRFGAWLAESKDQ